MQAISCRVFVDVMHELGIANSVVEAVRTEVARYPGTYPVRVGVRIGEITALDQEALRFCFEAITRETDYESLELQIELCARKHRCTNCGTEFVVHDYDVLCPKCASAATTCIAGEELELSFLEVEEYGTGSAGTKSTQ